jgi:hypothetical protein
MQDFVAEFKCLSYFESQDMLLCMNAKDKAAYNEVLFSNEKFRILLYEQIFVSKVDNYRAERFPRLMSPTEESDN